MIRIFRLTSLVVRNICSDAMLKLIGANCASLQVLIIANSKQVGYLLFFKNIFGFYFHFQLHKIVYLVGTETNNMQNCLFDFFSLHLCTLCWGKKRLKFSKYTIYTPVTRLQIWAWSPCVAASQCRIAARTTRTRSRFKRYSSTAVQQYSMTRNNSPLIL